MVEQGWIFIRLEDDLFQIVIPVNTDFSKKQSFRPKESTQTEAVLDMEEEDTKLPIVEESVGKDANGHSPETPRLERDDASAFEQETLTANHEGSKSPKENSATSNVNASVVSAEKEETSDTITPEVKEASQQPEGETVTNTVDTNTSNDDAKPDHEKPSIDIHRPVKRARTAYFIFADEKRSEVQLEVSTGVLDATHPCLVHGSTSLSHNCIHHHRKTAVPPPLPRH